MVGVEVKDGIVELNGVSHQREPARRRPNHRGENADGVTAVHDNLSWVEPITGFVTPPPDAVARARLPDEVRYGISNTHKRCV